jgi:two-component system CheB/CheR fusion protein
MNEDDRESPNSERPLEGCLPAADESPANSQLDNSASDSTGPDNPHIPTSQPLSPRLVPPIVGIGASAGGLEALQAFLSKVPPDCGMAFVVVTHTRPGRESLLPELLGSVTSMPILTSETSVRIAPNQIVVAKDSLLTISGGVLLSIQEESGSWTSYHPIDYFFRALATDQQENAIGIILSGSGHDGTLGIKAIKAAGGMVIVQDPASAKYASMPDSAISTRLADYVLRPDAMPAALLEYSRGPYLKLVRRAEAPPLPDDTIQAILVRLRARTGQDFTCYKKSTMSRRIERRMNVHHIEEPQVYLQYMRENPHELDLLQQELLISVTSFFRDGDSFRALAEKGIPRLLADREEGQTLRVWVAGCATGEEAYSVAILLREEIRKADRAHDIQIFATDLDERAIEVARSGLYPEGIAVDVSPERLQQCFSREDGAFRIHKKIRDMIVFAVQNVISDPPFTRMDLIVCRNLLIYLDSNVQQRVLPAFHYALRPGGLLFLGTSESLGEAGQLFETIDSKHKILRRRGTSVHIGPASVLPVPASRPGEPGAPEGTGGQTGPHVARAIERLLLKEFAPCSLVADAHGTVLYVHGRSGQYFQPEQGQPRNNILSMAREGLSSPLAGAMREARLKHRGVVLRGIMVRSNGEYVPVDLEVKPLAEPPSVRGMLLVTLRPAKGGAEAPGESLEQPRPVEVSPREETERELQHTRETLQTTIEELETSNEELKSSNEELQSINEELQSTNEELETSKEEMQSLNEELNTVNSELQSKVNALARANDDMNNLLNSMQVATIFLDPEMRIKRYTEQVRDVVRLIGSDIGRPLSDLTSTLDYPGLIEDCRRVLDTLIPREKEVEDVNGRWYMVRLMPYRTADNVIDGAVMTLVDIDRMKQAERKAALKWEFFESIVQTVREPLLVLDGKLRVVSANDAFCQAFATQTKQAEGLLVYELGNRQWDIPELRRLLETILPHDSVIVGFQVERDFPGIGRRTFKLSARRIKRGEKELELILLGFEDVTVEMS